jgi:hypothetical protein
MREAQAYLTRKLRERDLGGDLEGAKITLNEYLDRWLKTAVGPRVRPKIFQDSSRFCSCPSPDALWPTRHNRLQSLFALRAELAEGPLCAPAVAVTITASNVETRARPPDSCKLPISNSFASSPLVDPIGHSLIIPTLIRSWRCSCSLDNMLRRTSVCRKSDMRRPK